MVDIISEYSQLFDLIAKQTWLKKQFLRCARMASLIWAARFLARIQVWIVWKYVNEAKYHQAHNYRRIVKIMWAFLKLAVVLLVAAVANAAQTFTTAFTACPGVTDVLGIDSILVNFFNDGAILGKKYFSYVTWESKVTLFYVQESFSTHPLWR